MTERYEYRFEDHSILLKLGKPALGALVSIIPRQLTPNQVTVFGHLAAWSALAYALVATRVSAAGFAFLGAANLVYVVADCVDGMYARATNRASPIGEILDHWLDAYSVPAVPLGIGLAMDQPGWLVLAATALVSYAHFATFLHGFRVGHVQLGALGIIEGTVIGSLLCFAAAIFRADVFIAPRVHGMSIAGLLMISVLLGSLGAFGAMRGLLAHLRDLVPLTVLFGVVALWFTVGTLPGAAAGVLVLVLGAAQDGSTTGARLLRIPLVVWDPGAMILLVGAASLSLGLRLGASGSALAAGVVIVYAIARGAAGFTAAVLQLRRRAATAP